MAYEPDATDTEQAYLTWELAPVARARGRHRRAPHDKFPSYVTFDEDKHVRGGGNALASDRSGIEPNRTTAVPAASPCTPRTAGPSRGSSLAARRGAGARPSGLAKAPDADELAGCGRVRQKQVSRLRISCCPCWTATATIGFRNAFILIVRYPGRTSSLAFFRPLQVCMYLTLCTSYVRLSRLRVSRPPPARVPRVSPSPPPAAGPDWAAT